MQMVQQMLERGRNAWYANYAWRPARLCDIVNRALTIFVVTPAAEGQTLSTNYQRWTSSNRDGLFDRLKYVEVPRDRSIFWVPKLGEPIEQGILTKCLAVKTTIRHFMGASGHRIYYRTTGGLYWKKVAARHLSPWQSATRSDRSLRFLAATCFGGGTLSRQISET